MPFSRPTLDELIDQQRDFFSARLEGADGRLRRSILDVLARVIAVGLHGLYGFLSWIARQIFLDTAEKEQLERLASLFGIQRLAATFAALNVDLTGSDSFTVLTGTVLRRSDGIEYETTADATIVSGVATVPVVAREAGSASESDNGTKLTFLAPVPGVASTGTVSSTITSGTDRESDEDFRARALEIMRRPPRGGAAQDYVYWAKLVPGVTRVWVSYTAPGNQVDVLFVRDKDDPSIIPDSGEIAAVQASIDLYRPVTADPVVAAPTLQTQSFTIGGVSDLDVRAAIEAALKDLFERESVPGGTLLISHIREAISGAKGETDHVLTVPSADISIGATSVLVVGTITWAP